MDPACLPVGRDWIISPKLEPEAHQPWVEIRLPADGHGLGWRIWLAEVPE